MPEAFAQVIPILDGQCQQGKLEIGLAGQHDLETV